MNIKRLFVTSIEVSKEIILTTSLVNTVLVNTNVLLAPLNSAEKSSSGTNWPKLNPANWSSIVVLTVKVNGDVETPTLKGIPWTVNISPFLYPKPLSVRSNPITVPPDPIRASTLNPEPDPPVTDKSVYPVAIPTFMTGGNCAEYPVPPLTVVIPVIIPALLPVPTVAVSIAVDPTPNGFWISILNDPEKYPEPADNILTLCIDPAALTTADAPARTRGW